MKSRIPNAKLDVVGTSDMQDPIEELTKSLHPQDRVSFRFELIPEEAQIAHYSVADPCAFPRLYEPFGIPTLEAMIMANPSGASGVNGIREFAKPDRSHQTGAHVKSYEPNDPAWGITGALENMETARTIGRNCRRLVLDDYSRGGGVAPTSVGFFLDLLSESVR